MKDFFKDFLKNNPTQAAQVWDANPQRWSGMFSSKDDFLDAVEDGLPDEFFKFIK